MATRTSVGNAGAIIVCDGIVDLLDAGAGAATMKIYAGTVPDRLDAGVGAGTLLVTLTLADPAFGAAADDPANNAAKATADVSTPPSGVAGATGTASFFFAEDSDGTDILMGTAGEAADSTDATLDTKAISAGATITLTAWTFSVSEGGV